MAVFDGFGGSFDTYGQPFFGPKEFRTSNGTRYLKEPGIVCIARPSVSIQTMQPYLVDFEQEAYLSDPDELDDAAQLIKTAGQVCYHSFGPKRTMNENADKYILNIIKQGHGSVLEHANFTFFFWGVSRATTMELVRHRHFSFSQQSQRYVGVNNLRFVQRRLFTTDDILDQQFQAWIDNAQWRYSSLLSILETGPATSTLDRKRVHEAARDVLPNCTEAPLVVTGNVRAWRGFLDQRATIHAEPAIRELAFKTYLCLVLMEPLLFGDYGIGDDFTLETEFKKV